MLQTDYSPRKLRKTMVFSADSQIYRNLSAKNAEGMPFFRGNADNVQVVTDMEQATGILCNLPKTVMYT